MKELSIIVPVYNVEGYIEKCLSSLVTQDILMNDYEIIVINDGSTDNSLTFVEKFANGFSCIKVYSQHNQGLGSARNTGIRHSTGHYLMFVDGDDFVEPNLGSVIKRAKEMDLDVLRYTTWS